MEEKNFMEWFIIELYIKVKKHESAIITFINWNESHMIYDMYTEIIIKSFDKFGLDISFKYENKLSQKLLNSKYQMIKNINDIECVLDKLILFKSSIMNFAKITTQKKLSLYAHRSLMLWKPSYPSAQNIYNGGFWYDAKTKSVKCFCCTLVIKEWHLINSPFYWHKKLSPNCAFAKYF